MSGMADFAKAVNALHRAVVHGHLRQCQRLVAAHSPKIITALNWRLSSEQLRSRVLKGGTSPLHACCQFGRKDILAFFLTFPDLDLDVHNRRGETPLAVALVENKLRCYGLLAAAGATLIPENASVVIRMLCAVAAGNVQFVEQLLQDYSSSFTDPHVCLRVLRAAAGLGQAAMLSFLLSQKAFRQSFDRRSPFSPTLEAVVGGHCACLELLFAAGLIFTPAELKQALLAAAEIRHPDMLRRVLEIPGVAELVAQPGLTWSTLLMHAVRAGNVECVEILRSAGGDLQACTPGDWDRVLGVAAWSGRVEMILHVLKELRLNACNKRPQTSTLWAFHSSQQNIVNVSIETLASCSIECCRVLLDAGVDPLRVVWRTGKTILHLVCQNDDDQALAFWLAIPAVRKLIDVAQHTDGSSSQRWWLIREQTALMYAAGLSSSACTEVLLSAGADPTILDKHGRTALHYAALSECADNIRRLAQASRALIDMRDEDGMTALMQAADNNQPSNVQALLEFDADTRIQDRRGHTVLRRILAKREAHPPEIFDLLLSATSATINLQNHSSGKTLLMSVLGERYFRKVSKAATKSVLPVVRLFLKHGASIHPQNEDGRTVLHLEAMYGRPELLQLLLEASSIDAVNMQDKDGETALARWLRRRSWVSMTPGPRNFQLVELFLQHGALISPTNKAGRNGLHRAAELGSVDLLKLLLRASCAGDINSQDHDGETPLMLAVRQPDSRPVSGSRVPMMIKLLLKHGALIHLKNKDGKTAKDLAKDYYRIDMRALLQAHEDYLAALGHNVKPASRALKAPRETASEAVPRGLILRLDVSDADVPPLGAEEENLIDHGPVALGTIPITDEPLAAAPAYDSVPAPPPLLDLSGLHEELAALLLADAPAEEGE
eukprot:m.12219 g.12219  ORF g.12219 m.12219 type:complete len:894 (+) comp17354_c0_seq2:86-2767(+)